MRKIFAVLIAVFLAAFGAASAQAATDFDNAPQGAHYANGSSEPVCTLAGVTLSCTGTQIVGVGNTNADLVVSVTSTFTGYCHNPGSKNKVVDPFTRSRTSTSSTTLTPSKNGRLVVPSQTVTGTGSQQFLDSFTCPNPNWTPEVTGTSISYEYSLTFVGFTEPAIYLSGP